MNSRECFRLDGKKALVTGGGQGLGKAFARTLAEAGADVAISDIRGETASNAAEDVRALGRQALAIRADISRMDDVTQMVGKVMKTWAGSISRLIMPASPCRLRRPSR